MDPLDILVLQRLVLDFAYRDRGRWEALLALFTPDATIHVSWFSGPIAGFVEASRAMAERRAPPAKHLIGPPRIDIAGDRAVGETDVVIQVRLPMLTGEVDVTSWAQFHDRFVRTDAGWRIARRIAVYEKDRIDTVGGADLGAGWSEAALADYPPAYKHLAKLLSAVGQKIVPGTLVCGSAEEADLLIAAGRWLAGD